MSRQSELFSARVFQVYAVPPPVQIDTGGFKTTGAILFTRDTADSGSFDVGIVRLASGIVSISDGLGSNANGRMAAAAIGPSASQQHTLPAVASDTVTLIAATQTLTNKTITAPVVNTIGPTASQQHTLPAVASDTIALIAATQTLTNKTLTTPTIASIITASNGDLQLSPNGTGVVDVNYAVIALGGGVAPTLGTIGGSGPATAAQNSWVKIKTAGTVSFIPIWR